MANAYLDWLEAQAERELSRHRAQVDTAKLLVTFSAAIAATLAATALQVGQPSSRWDKIAVVILGLAIVGVIFVVLADRLGKIDHFAVLRLSAINKWSQTQLVRELRKLTIAAADQNDLTVRRVRWIAMAQVAASVMSGCASIASLL